jgi:beta-phosphoglucomutase family hydrolase
MFKGAIFDLDGVIVDTVPLHFEAWKYLFETVHGIPFSKTDYDAKVDGKPRIDGVRSIMPSLTKEEAIAAGNVKQRYYLELIEQGKLVQFTSSVKLIKELIAHKILLAAASSSKNARFILSKIGLLSDFNAIISGDDFTHGKPHPEIFLNAAKALKLDVKECIVFEDSIAGVQAAKAGGFICVGIDRHNNPANYHAADLVVKDLAEVSFATLKGVKS